MGQALYRKHRPKQLSEVVGQEHITGALQTALKQGRISHAYLFSGPRGVGKTSVARILAHEVNQLPYTDDSLHIDIIEIDAASNRRIDEIRELRDKVHVAPTGSQYKVYIIDEVHMLTREAMAALLKTLEEPPAHAIFILATTDAHKLPETIISRTQRYNFKPVEVSQVVAHLQRLAKADKIDVNSEALKLLAEHGQGSLRDSISLLDQAANYGKQVDAAAVLSLLGIPPAEVIDKLLDLLAQGDLALVAGSLNGLFNQGYQAAAIAKQLSQKLRGQLVAGQSVLPKPTKLLERLLAVPVSHDPERLLEIILLEFAAPQAGAPVQVASQGDEPEPAPNFEEANQPAKGAQPKSPKKKVSGDADALWPAVLNALKKKHNTLYGVVRMAQPTFQGDTLTLAFAFAFHQKRLSEARNQQLLADVIKEISGQSFKIECLVDKSLNVPPPEAEQQEEPLAELIPTDASLSAISNIFGGGELLDKDA